MAVGRVALLGDAAFLARPHVAAGVTKAAEDALALATALQSNGGVESALQRPRQLSATAADECRGAPQSRTAQHPASRDERDRGAGFSAGVKTLAVANSGTGHFSGPAAELAVAAARPVVVFLAGVSGAPSAK